MTTPTRTSRPLWLAFTALLLMVGAAGLAIWLSSGPSLYASGHYWALCSSTGQTFEPDSTSDQDRFTFDGNVRLLSLLYAEHFTDEEGERIRSAPCHVLIDLPPEASLWITGGGGSDQDGFNNYKTARVVVRGEAEKPPLEQTLKVRYRFSDQRLEISIGKDAFGAPAGTEAGNVFVLRINADARADEFLKSGELVPDLLNAKDVQRLMKQADRT